MILICTASSGKNLELAQRIKAFLETKSVPCRLLDLTEIELPLYTSREIKKPSSEAIESILSVFREAQSFIFISPEYNGSIPPVLSNAIAWLSRQGDDFRQIFNDKSAVIASHSGGGGQKLLTSLRIQLSHLGVNVLGRTLLGQGHNEVRQSSLEDVVSRLLRHSNP